MAITIPLPKPKETDGTADYIQTSIAQFLGLAKHQYSHIPPMPLHLQRLFLRVEEYEHTFRDQWDNWEHPYSENYQRHTLWIPEVDLWLHDMRAKLKSSQITTLPLWPKGHQFAICLTHDVDHISDQLTFSQRMRSLIRDAKAKEFCPKTKAFKFLKNTAKLALRKSASMPRTSQTLEKCYSIEKEFGISSTYFFTVYPINQYSLYDCIYSPNDPCLFLNKPRTVGDVMRILLQEGFDIGLHGSYLSALEIGLLSEQKAFLEKTLSATVNTTRQHWLHWKAPVTPNLQAQAGFKADTTLGYNRNIGFRCGTSLPFFLFDYQSKKVLPLVELPLIIQDGALISNNALEFPPEEAIKPVKKLIDSIFNLNGCVTILFHPDIFLKPGLDLLYRQIIRYCLEKNGWVANVNEIQQWWRSRNEKLEKGLRLE